MTRLLTARHAVAAAAILREVAAGHHGFAYALADAQRPPWPAERRP